MLQPGAKNWIEKYFSLVEAGEIDLNTLLKRPEITEDKFLHSVFFETGIIFGYPIDFVFCGSIRSKNWTLDERISLLLFESLLLIYLTENKRFDKNEFIASLLAFYEQYHTVFSLNILKLLLKESESVKLESILKGRTHKKSSIKNQLWVNYFNNNVVYIDVLAYRSFLKNENQFEETYQSYIESVLYAVTTMSLVDDIISPIENQIINIFLYASSMNEEERANFQQKMEEKWFSIHDIKLPQDAGVLFKLYLLDMAVLTVHSDLSVINEEVVQLQNLCMHLELPLEELEHSILIINRFIMQNNDEIRFLQDKSSYEELYGNFSKRWIKILGRNREKLVEELKDNKELISLVNKSFTEELSTEEKEKVKSQFKDLIRSVPAFAIFMLPGGMLLLPLILRIIPDLIPSSFKRNQIED